MLSFNLQSSAYITILALHPYTVEASFDLFQKFKESGNIYRGHSIKSSKSKEAAPEKRKMDFRTAAWEIPG
jgi:hypothetical protein